MLEQSYSQGEAHFLGSAKHQVAAQAGEDNSALVTEENQRHCDQKRSDTALRNDDVDEPLKQQRREQREQAAGGYTQKTGQVPVQKWPNLLDQPDEFGRQPVRPSLVSDGGQRTASRMPARSAIMSSLGTRL